MNDFFIKHIKLIIISILIILAFVIFFIFKNDNVKIEEYSKIEYNYFAMYSKNDKVGVIDKTGKILIKPEYLDVFIPNPSKDVFICYENSDSYKFLNSKGEELYSDFENVDILQTSDLSLEFDKNFLRFRKDGKYGLINYEGIVIVSANYDELTSLKNKPGEILAKKKEKLGVIDSSRKY